MKIVNELEKHKIIAILRGFTSEQAGRAVDALYAGGIRFVEVTANTSGWKGMVQDWRSRYGSRMWIGAGTVLDLAMAKEAHEAGAQFLVTPNTDPDVINFAVSKGIPIIPGAMTPTEIVSAWRAGATAVKLFPMASLGLSYFKEIRAPLDRIRLIPTGGINLDNMAGFLDAGAFGLGMGSSLVDQKTVTSGKYQDITASAQAYTDLVKSHHQSIR